MSPHVAQGGAASGGASGQSDELAAGAVVNSDCEPTAEEPFSEQDLQCIRHSVEGYTYVLATAQECLPYIAMMAGSNFPEPALGMRTAQLRTRSQELAVRSLAQLSAAGPHPPRIPLAFSPFSLTHCMNVISGTRAAPAM